MGSWKGRGNQYIEFARVVYCKLPTNGKQPPASPLKAMPGIEPRPQRWEARVLPLCHHGPCWVYKPLHNVFTFSSGQYITILSEKPGASKSRSHDYEELNMNTRVKKAKTASIYCDLQRISKENKGM